MNIEGDSKSFQQYPRPDYTPHHIRQRQHGHHHLHTLRDEDSLAELDELPSDKVGSLLSQPPVVPPRMRRQQRLSQMKLSSEAEDLISTTRHMRACSAGPNIPSYFTLPSMGYSYFSMTSMSVSVLCNLYVTHFLLTDLTTFTLLSPDQ